MKKRVVIMGAAGRDFHVFLTVFKNNPLYELVCFTAEQIPNIAKRSFPKKLAGRLYSRDIPIRQESELPKLIKEYRVDEVVLAYSDLSHVDVMHKASLVLSCGASFRLIGPKETMLESKVPVVSVTAVRTGCGKSQTSRKIAQILQGMGKRVVAVRHPMPYGDLVKQEVQRFSSLKDLVSQECTIEEQEEYTPWIELGIPVYAGVDYEKILRKAEKESDVVIFDGGNNDFSFFKSDLYVTVVDPLRPGHELLFYPGETNLLLADVVVVNKVKAARKKDIDLVVGNVRKHNPRAVIVKADSKLIVSDTNLKRKKVLIVGDGPTLTHGGMAFGAGTIAARRYGAVIVDPRPYAVGSIKKAYQKYTHVHDELPALGYSKEQVKELESTINRVKADLVIDGTPFRLKQFLKLNKPIVEVDYVLDEVTRPNLSDLLKKVVK